MSAWKMSNSSVTSGKVHLYENLASQTLSIMNRKAQVEGGNLTYLIIEFKHNIHLLMTNTNTKTIRNIKINMVARGE